LAGSKHINGSHEVFYEIKKFINKNNLQSSVIMPGYIKKKQALYYYKNAYVYVFPSIDEGFGIPLIEAMSSKVPVICSNIEIFKEIGDDAVIYFKKMDEHDLYHKLKIIYENNTIVDNLILKGIKRAFLFNQKKFIEGFEKLF